MPKPGGLPKNHTPVILNQDFSVNENSPNGTIVGTVIASDPDGDPLTYSIVSGKNGGNSDGAFAIDPLTGVITVANGSLLDYETLASRSLTIRVADQVSSAQATIKIAVNDVFEFSGVIDLASLDGVTGFRIDGIDVEDRSGWSVSSAGDVNGDGFDDLVIGAPWGDPGGNSRAGESYVVFGKGTAFSASLDLASLDGTNGFRIDGIGVGDLSGHSVSSAGDINGDGFDDLIIGAFGADPDGKDYAGESYVVFGKGTPFSENINLSELDGTNGFVLRGSNALDSFGYSVSSAGDVNGDGFDDLIIGAPHADPNGRNYAGESYVVFGKGGDFSASIDLSTLDGTNGFVLFGGEAGSFSGFSVSSAGDVNGDGVDDLIIGAPSADPGGDSRAGSSYIVFGKTTGFSASLDLASLDGTNGFRIDGINVLDNSGWSVSSAGDVNGDGFDDVIIGAYGVDARHGGANTSEGESYVVFGKGTAFSASLDLATLDGTNGFRIGGIDKGDHLGWSVSSAGDVNGDGIDDLIIGAYSADPGGDLVAGESYVVFGRTTGFSASLNLAALDGTNGFRIDGIDPEDSSGWSVSSAGDVNGDGFDDLIIGALRGDPGGDSNAGESYVIFGRDFAGVASFSLADADLLM